MGFGSGGGFTPSLSDIKGPWKVSGSTIQLSSSTITFNGTPTGSTAGPASFLCLDPAGTLVLDEPAGGGGGGISWDGSTANGVATFKDADEATVEANLTFDGSTLTVTGNITGSAAVTALGITGVSLDVQSGGISNAGAIAGATSIVATSMEVDNRSGGNALLNLDCQADAYSIIQLQENDSLFWQFGHKGDDNTFYIRDSSSPTSTILTFQQAGSGDAMKNLIFGESTGKLGVMTGEPTEVLSVNGTFATTGSATFKSTISGSGATHIVGAVTLGNTLKVTGSIAGAGLSLSNNDAGTANTIFGSTAGAAVAAGCNYNVMVGHQAGNAVSTGDANVVMGFQAGLATTALSNAVIIGAQAGKAVLTADADYLVAVGGLSCAALTEGQYNVAVGTFTLNAEVSGDGNTAIGHSALKNQTGVDGWVGNTAVGALAGDALVGGIKNTMVGQSAGSTTTAGQNLVIIGADAGNANLTAAASGSIFVGYNAGTSLTSGEGNVAIGYAALDAETSGHWNTAVGHNALTIQNGAGTDAVGNTAIGWNAGANITVGQSNTAVGAGALDTETTGDQNTAVGFNALTAQAAGADGEVGNTGIGYQAGKFVSTGQYNTFVGNNAGAVTVGNPGTDKLTGDSNTAIGAEAGKLLRTTGNTNTLVGYQAGDVITTGAGNVIIGSAADPSAAGATNQVVIGGNTTGTGDNEVALGNTSITAIAGEVAFATYSDARIKRNIKATDLGLSFINSLRPVKYQRVNPADYPSEILEPRFKGDDPNPRPDEDVAFYDGLIAQEVKATMEEHGVTCSAWDETPSDGRQRIKYAILVTPLIKAVQELSAKISELEDKLKGQ